jgi:hypothetical protein
MSDVKLVRLSGAALVAGGVCVSLFWILVAPLRTFAGADVVRHPLWTPSQSLHVAGALLAMYGIVGLYAAIRRTAGLFGVVGFVLALAGMALFLADGLVALAVFPALAAVAPDTLAPDGAMNQGSVLILFIAIAAVNMIGQMVLGTLLLQSGSFPRAAVLLVLVGGLVFNLPPGPVPLPVVAAGGVLWGAGAVWLGFALIRLVDRMDELRTRDAVPRSGVVAAAR